ncbi:MAG: beta-N-acetylhexosaminidase [Bacteroidales bacterium]|nr:beta-N-acetylhexosaminidase [Bacteroidales bacterium]
MAKTEKKIEILPYPTSVEFIKGSDFKASGAQFYMDPALDSISRLAVARLADKLSSASGKISPVVVGLSVQSRIPSKGFVFVVDKKMAPESYTLAVNGKLALVKASDARGFLYATQTIRQLLPAEIYGKTAVSGLKWTIPALIIEDTPRFGYRGMHLDCSRHFWTVDEVKKYLDIMAVYKLNTFHWHLTDDQGWRVEIKKYPRLTEVGAYRAGTAVKRNFETHDGLVYGGFYTQDQLRDVVAYAKGLGIEVIPEIDLPGHMLGVLAAYPELGCTGGPYQVWTRWGVSDDVLCPGKGQMFTFLQDVFDELCEIFPSKYIHIGGDECPKERWKNCPDCQRLIKELGIVSDSTHTAEMYLQNYVTMEVQKYLSGKGRKIIGWDEILEGKLGEGATVMAWRRDAACIKSTGLGFPTILTPMSYCYFDFYQSDNEGRKEEPYGIGGELPVEKVYSFEPADVVTDPESQKHILGVQANLWTEYIATNDHLEYMLLPRLAALSEVQWSPKGSKDIERLKSSLEKHFRIYEIMGYKANHRIQGKPGLPGAQFLGE